MPDWLTLALAAWMASVIPGAKGPAAVGPSPAPVFDPKARTVTNWRTEATASLDLGEAIRAALQAGGEPRQVTRCVRLNNYWCIKRAGWAGEIAADRDGHVAFASAAEGADVAALLLRRYYLDYGRHSAYAIVSHWAPSSCGAPFTAMARGRRVARSDRPGRLATHGVGNTLRARFLAARGRRGRLRISRVPDRLIASAESRAPAIAVGMGEQPVKLPALLDPAAIRALGAPAWANGISAPKLCAGDEPRIRAYAEKAAAGIAPTIAADLKLFHPDGTPTANLNRLMHNMSAVEIGPLGATQVLVDMAVERAAGQAARTSTSGPPATRP